MRFFRTKTRDHQAKKHLSCASRSMAIQNFRGLRFEALEDRRLLSIVTWNGGTSGTGTSFETATNWVGGKLPGPSDEAYIPPAFASETITSATSITIQSLVSEAALQITAGTFTVGTTAEVDNTFSLSGGILAAATVQPGSGGQGLTVSGGTLNGVTVAASVTVPNGGSLYVTNGLTLNNANVTLNSTNSWTYVYFQGTQTLGGTGQIIFGGSTSYNEVYSEGGNTVATAATLTIGPNITVQGTEGGAITGYYSQDSVVNQGTIDADVSGQTITVSAGSAGTLTNQRTLEATNSGTLSVGGAWSNAGTIIEKNATLNLGGTFTAAGLGTINRTGGTVNLTGTLTNTANTLNLDTTTGSLNLSGGGTITNGTITANVSQLTVSSGTLNGVTLATNATVANGGSLDAKGGLTLNNANVTLNSTSTYTYLYFQGTQTLTGTGQIVFGGGYPYNDVYSEGGNTVATAATLTIGPNITVQGTEGGTITGYYSQDSVVNQGTIDADASGQTITVSAGSAATLTNQGTMEAVSGGILGVSGAWSSTGTVTETGGSLNLSGTWSNTMAITATGGTLNLSGTWSNPGTITDTSCTLTTSGTWSDAGTITVTNSTLNLGGTFTTPVISSSGSTVNLTGTMNNAGNTLALSSGSWNVLGGTIDDGTVTASGGSELVLTSSGGTLNGVTVNGPLDLTASGAYATVTDGLTLNGTATLGYQARLSFSGGSQTLGGTGTVVFDNASYQGLIAAANNMTLTIGAGITILGGNSQGNSTSSGSVIGDSTEWASGTNASVVNLGTIDAGTSGMSIVVDPNGSFTNQGTMSANNGGTLDLSGTFTTATLGTINCIGGTLNLAGTLNNAGSTLTLNSGSWNLLGGTVNGGTISELGGSELAVTSSGGTLNGVTVNGPLDLTATNAYATVTSGLTLNGTATLGSYAHLNFTGGSQTLGGTGTVIFNNASYEGLITATNNMTLTIGVGITIIGGNNQGNSTTSGAVIGDSTEWASGTNASVVNLGTIDAGTSGMSIVVDPNGSFTNQGTMSANNGGTLDLSGTFTTATLGTINCIGGTLNLAGTLNNAGSTLTLNSGSWNLLGGTVNGGTISELGGSELAVTSSGGTLNGVTVNGPLDLTATNAYATVTSGLTLNGTATLGSYAHLNFSGGSQTLAGTATVIFDNASYQGLITATNNMTFTIGAGITIIGGNNQGNSTASGAVIGDSTQWASGSNASIVNLGTISSNTSGMSIVINPNGSFTNQGTMSANNGGTLDLSGTFTTATLGTINCIGGTLNLAGTLNNAGSTLTLNSGSWNLLGGTVNGGTVTESGGSELVVTSSGGTLNGVTVNGPLDLTATNAYATVTSGLTLNGTATLGSYAHLNFSGGSQTLAGTATVIFNNASYQGLITATNNMTLTIGAGITILGGNNQGTTTNNQGTITISTSSGSVIGDSTEWASGTNASIVNLGTIDAGTSGMSIVINPNGSFVNQGTMSANNGGTLDLSGTFTTATLGTINGIGGTLNLAGTLNNTGSTLTLNSGSWSLVGGTINGGTVTESGGSELVVTSSGGTLNGVTVNGPLDLTANGAYATVTDGLTMNGTATLGYQARLSFSGGSQTLGGTGTVVFNNAQYQGLIAAANNMTLTIGAGITILGGNNQGDNLSYGSVIGYSSWAGGGSNASIVNLGTISAGTSGMSIIVNPNGGTFTNQGTLSASNGGTLYLGGTVAQLGTFNSTGGTVNITGTLENSGSTLALSAATGSLALLGGTVIGGTISESAGAEFVMTSSGGTLNGVTVNGPLDLTASGAYAYVINGLTLNGTATLGYQARLYFNGGSQTLGGTGTVVFNNAQYQGLIAAANNMTLTIGAGITILGGNNQGDNLSYGSVIGYSSWAGGGSNASIVNLGTIDAGTSGMSIIVNPNGGAFTNQGTLSASNGGTLYLGGTVAQLGTFSSTGGTVNITGTLENSGSTLALNAATGSLTLSGTILGGTINESGGAELVPAAGTLSGVTVNGPLDLTASGANAYVTNGLTLNGTATLGYQARLYFNGGSQTLGGTGTVVFNNAQYQGLIANVTNMTLTIGAGITIVGGNNQGNNLSSGAVIGYSSQWSGGSNTSIVNLGTIDAGTSGMSIIVNPNGGTFTNQGTLAASNGGTLYLGGTVAQLGTFDSNSGTLNITGALENGGSTLALSAATGSLTLGGTIVGGAISESGGAELVPAGGTLDAVTVNGPLDLTASNASFGVTNGLTLNGTATLGAYAALYFNGGSQTLGGTGTMVFNNDSYQGLIANVTNMTLTIGAGITILGGNNQGDNLSSGSVIGDSSYFGGGSNTSIVNLGTINAGTSGMSIVVNTSGTITNQGTIEDGNGGTLYVSSSLINNGTINPGGIGQVGAITVNGTFTQLPSGVLNIDIGGTTAGKTFDQLVVSGLATLDGTADVSRINGYIPTAGTSIPFLTYGSQSGSFATVTDANLGDSVGYSASSATMTLNLPASAPPQVTAVNPPNGSIRTQNLGSVQISFSKGLNPATLIAANFTLKDGNGNTYASTSIQLSNGNSQVQLNFNPLPAGSYTLTLNAPAIMDPEGNALGTSNYVTQFTLGYTTAVFVNSAGGSWNTASNWQNDQVPGPNSNVVINTGNPSATITFSSGTATINSLTSAEPFTLSGGTLTVNGNVQVNNTFTLAGGTLANATVLAGTGGQGITCTSSGGTLEGVTLARMFPCRTIHRWM